MCPICLPVGSAVYIFSSIQQLWFIFSYFQCSLGSGTDEHFGHLVVAKCALWINPDSTWHEWILAFLLLVTSEKWLAPPHAVRTGYSWWWQNNHRAGKHLSVSCRVEWMANWSHHYEESKNKDLPHYLHVCRSQRLSAAMFSHVPLCSPHKCIPHQHKSFTCSQKWNAGDIFCDYKCGGGMKLNKWLIPLCVFSCCVLLLFTDPEGCHLITIQAVNIA